METTTPLIENETDQAIKILQETTRLRQLRARISSGAGVIILLLLIFLFADATFFVKHYNTTAVVDEIKAQAPRLMNSIQMKTLLTSIRKEILPKYVNELSRKLKLSQPVLEKECTAFLTSLSTDIGPVIQKRIVADLQGIMVETRVLLKKRHPDLTEEDIVSIMDTLVSEVEKQYTERITEQVTMMFNDINETFTDLRKTALYETLAKKDTADLERMLLTTSLELLIYEIDPDAGAKVEGGRQ